MTYCCHGTLGYDCVVKKSSLHDGIWVWNVDDLVLTFC